MHKAFLICRAGAGAVATAAMLTLALPAWAVQRVVLLAPGDLAPPARHGLAKLEQALRSKGIEVTTSTDPAKADFVILAGAGPSQPAIAEALRELRTEVPRDPEALAIRRGKYRGRPAVILSGADARGLMYAALDTASRISWSSGAADPFQYVVDTTEKPYLVERGISMYTMQRAYFESRLHDQRYWQRYFDMLAESRINTFVVIFGYENGGFMAPLYPFFFDVERFPEVQLVGITREQQAKNTAAFKALMRMAHERGIGVTAGIWDHIYRGGVQGGGVPGASDVAGKRVPGLVSGVTTENLAPYTKAALRRFLEVFPEVDSIQFRMHEESGLKKDEIKSFWHDVFAFIKQARPEMPLDLRAKGLPDSVIEDALNQGIKARVNTKYWMEQMGLPFHPTHINAGSQRSRRHGYADLLRYPQHYRVHWQVWSGGTLRFLLWGDPDYVRRFAQSARLYDGNSFEVNEMLATKMLGEAHDAAPREILNSQYRYFDYEFERYWHFYQSWGRLSYNPQTPPQVWEMEFSKRFGKEAGASLMNGLHLASEVLPRIVAASYRYFNFPTTRGWAEMERQGDLPTYATEEGSDIQQFMNVRDEAKSIIEGTDTAMRRPQETSRWFAQTSDKILVCVAEAEKANGNRPGKEFRSTITDLKILAGLARYHSWRLRAGVYYNLYKQAGDLASFDEAIANEKRAIEAWRQIVAAAGDVYSENLVFGVLERGFRRHWKDELSFLERDFQQLLAERQKATPRPNAKPVIVPERRPIDEGPVVRLQPASTVVPGQELLVSAKVSADAGIKWVRLRYRHVSQFEDYNSAEMTADSRTGLYTGRIPAAFIDPKWDLMYFVEAVDNKGTGRMYPDLEVETPYVVVAVKR